MLCYCKSGCLIVENQKKLDMFLRGKVTVDPEQLTHIKVEKPEGSFRKLFYHITGGKVGDKKEIETLKAISIIQQMHSTFACMGIDNVIRINHDDIEIYFDTKGEKADLDFAMDKYSIEIDETMSKYFDSLWMVLEHEDEEFKYLIEISVNRNHKVNEYPIEIIVSGLLKEFGDLKGEQLKNKLNDVFKNQKRYDRYINDSKQKFDSFLNNMSFELQKRIRVDDVKIQSTNRLIVQKEQAKKSREEAKPSSYAGTPYAYYGFSDFLLYSVLWSELCFDRNIHVSDAEIINEDGHLFGEIGESGMDAVEGSIFDKDVSIEDLSASDGSTLLEGDSFLDTSDSGVFESAFESDSGGWFDSVSDGGFDFDF